MEELPEFGSEAEKPRGQGNGKPKVTIDPFSLSNFLRGCQLALSLIFLNC
jgi:hypothetical protein